MTDTLRFRWLGTAGIELESGGERILIDPYLSRFPLRFAVFGRPPPKRDLVVRSLSGARAVLVSHAHFDHLLDVSAVCREFGAVAYGSPNSCAILRAHGIPSEQVKTAKPGDVFSAGPFEIRILAGEHGRMLGLLPFAGKLPPRLSPPLRLSEYRMDSTFSFHIQASGKTALVWNSPESRDVPRADVLFYCPLWGVWNCAAAAAAAHSGIIVPIHWDDFFSSLDRPIRPLIAPPGWNSPWIRRMDPESFARSLRKILPGVKFLIPGVLKWFEINGNL